jgi:hypothetical protein
MNLFLANHELAYQHKFDDPKDTLEQLHQDFYLAEITRLLVPVAVSVRMLDDQQKASRQSEAYLEFVRGVDTGNYIGSYTENDNPQPRFNVREACNKILHAETVRPLFDKGDDPHASDEESEEEVAEKDEYSWWFLTGEIELAGRRQNGTELACCLHVPSFLEIVLDVVSFRAR